MCHVLVIEDEWLLAEHISYLAEQAGGTSIVTVATQDEAVQAARVARPDIILSDVMLAMGRGPLAVEAIHAEHGEMPVIFITGTPEDCHPCAPPGIVISKPIDEQRVIAAFREMAPL